MVLAGDGHLVAVLDARHELLEHDPRLLRQKGFVKGLRQKGFVKKKGFVKRASSKAMEKASAVETEGSSARGSGQRLRVQWPGLSRGEWAEAQGHPARPEEAAEAELATEGWCFRMPMRRAPWAPIAFRWRR